MLQDVLDNGMWDTDGEVRPVYKDGRSAHSKSVFGKQVEFEQGEIPIITSKHTPVQSSINEVVHAFFRLKTNKVKDFEGLGIGYWKEWGDEHGTIGESYGVQLAKQRELIGSENDPFPLSLDQVDNILHKLEHDPYSRRIMFSYWNPNDVHKKSLQECCWAGQFNIRNNKLDFTLIQRSVDLLHGIPTNWTGYYALQCAFANLFNLEVGRFIHQMGNVHLYDNQIELAKEVIEAPEYEQPTLWINPEVTNFYDYTVDDIKIKNYNHGKRVRADLAI